MKVPEKYSEDEIRRCSNVFVGNESPADRMRKTNSLIDCVEELQEDMQVNGTKLQADNARLKALEHDQKCLREQLAAEAAHEEALVECAATDVCMNYSGDEQLADRVKALEEKVESLSHQFEHYVVGTNTSIERLKNRCLTCKAQPHMQDKPPTCGECANNNCEYISFSDRTCVMPAWFKPKESGGTDGGSCQPNSESGQSPTTVDYMAEPAHRDDDKPRENSTGCVGKMDTVMDGDEGVKVRPSISVALASITQLFKDYIAHVDREEGTDFINHWDKEHVNELKKWGII